MNMSPKFSPRLRKALLTSDKDTPVSGLVEISPAANRNALRHQLESVGAHIESWSDQARLVSISIPAGRLEELDSLDDVVYVETGGKFSY